MTLVDEATVEAALVSPTSTHGRVRAWFAQLRREAAQAFAWLITGPADIAVAATTWFQRVTRRPRHSRSRFTWQRRYAATHRVVTKLLHFGRFRSTFEQSSIRVQRRETSGGEESHSAFRESDDFVNYVAQWCEQFRYHRAVMSGAVSPYSPHHLRPA